MTRFLTIMLCIYSITSLGYDGHTKHNSGKYDSNTIKVAILDTGFDFKSDWKRYDHLKVGPDKKLIVKPKLCNMGHKDFSKTGIHDGHGHGTHVAGIMAKYAGNANYCLVIIKTWDNNSIENRTDAVAKGFKYATKLGVDIINYSGGGVDFNIYEYLAVKKALDKGIIVVAAAGNEGESVDYHVQRVKIHFSYAASDNHIVYRYTPYFMHRKTSKVTKKAPANTWYPAAYDPRIIAVKNIYRNKKLRRDSNRGEAFSHQEIGHHVLSILPNNSIGYMSGTSQAAPTRVGKIIKSWNK